MKIVGIVGTVFGSRTKIAVNSFKFNSDVDYEIIDLSNYNIPFADGRTLNDYDEETVNLINKIIDADGIIIGTPIYQASIPGSLKNLFDLLPANSIQDKPVGIIVTSGSDKHYLVPEYQLIPVLNYLKADVINKYVYITGEDFDVNSIINEEIDMRMEALVEELIVRTKRYKDKYSMFDF